MAYDGLKKKLKGFDQLASPTPLKSNAHNMVGGNSAPKSNANYIGGQPAPANNYQPAFQKSDQMIKRPDVRFHPENTAPYKPPTPEEVARTYQNSTAISDDAAAVMIQKALASRRPDYGSLTTFVKRGLQEPTPEILARASNPDDTGYNEYVAEGGNPSFEDWYGRYGEEGNQFIDSTNRLRQFLKSLGKSDPLSVGYGRR